MRERLRSWWAIPTGWNAARIVSRPPGDLERFRSDVPCHLVTPTRAACVADLLDTVTSGYASFLQRMRGTTPFRYRERTCARARGGMRWGPMVNALGFQRRCYRVTGHLRAR